VRKHFLFKLFLLFFLAVAAGAQDVPASTSSFFTAFDLSKISKADGTEVSGILGFITLRFMTLKIDYRDGLVDFDYAKNRWH
jgi:hypothetical protein